MIVEMHLNGRLFSYKVFPNASERIMFVQKFNARARAKGINYRAVIA